jgi:6-phosphogluconolactonase
MAKRNIEKSLVYVGTYSQFENESIFLFGMNNETGELNFIQSFEGGQKPSYFAFDKSHNYLYAVNELDNFEGKKSGAVRSFSVDHEKGFLTLLNSVSSLGELPAQITLSPDGKVVLVANYKTGSVVVYPVQENGSLGDASELVHHKGSSVDIERQQSAHAHLIIFSPDNRFVFVVDLGMDKIIGYRLETNNGIPKLTSQAIAFNSSPGTGPRQMCFHPNGKYAYLIHELKSVVAALFYDSERGIFTEMQMISTIPENFSSKNYCGGINISANGKYLYGSNRGHDTIVVFSVDTDNGKLSHVENVPSGGKWPREFTIDLTGNFLLAANEHSDNITTFKIDKITGRLSPIRHMKVEKPSFVQVIPQFK